MPWLPWSSIASFATPGLNPELLQVTYARRPSSETAASCGLQVRGMLAATFIVDGSTTCIDCSPGPCMVTINAGEGSGSAAFPATTPTMPKNKMRRTQKDVDTLF